VDIYTRVFDSGGAPMSDEFLVNVSSNICFRSGPGLRRPMAASWPRGWKRTGGAQQRMGHLRAAVYQCVCGWNVTRGEHQLYGDQYSPKNPSFRFNILGCLDQPGEDSSREGVYGSYLNDDGTVSGNEFLVNTTFLDHRCIRFWVPTAQDVYSRHGQASAWEIAGYDLYGKSMLIPPARRWDE